MWDQKKKTKTFKESKDREDLNKEMILAEGERCDNIEDRLTKTSNLQCKQMNNKNIIVGKYGSVDSLRHN